MAGQPQRAARHRRRRERLAQRYAAATTPVGRLRVAYEYLRGAASGPQPDPAEAGRVIDELTHDLIAAADRLLGQRARLPLQRAVVGKEER